MDVALFAVGGNGLPRRVVLQAPVNPHVTCHIAYTQGCESVRVQWGCVASLQLSSGACIDLSAGVGWNLRVRALSQSETCPLPKSFFAFKLKSHTPHTLNAGK